MICHEKSTVVYEPSQLRTFGNDTLTKNVRNLNMRPSIFDAEKNEASIAVSKVHEE